MRATVGLIAFAGVCSAPAVAQDALTLDFGGRAGIGWLNSETSSNTPVGFSYDGYVLRAEGTGTLDLAVSDRFNLGAVARVSLQKGQDSHYSLVRPLPTTAPGAKFDSQDIDVALYAALGPVTLSFGEMQTAFELATRNVEHGGSILDGGNAVWQTIGDAKGSLGSVDSNSQGPGEPNDFTTIRADVAVSDFVFSVSESRPTTFANFFDIDTTVRSSGVTWERDIGEGKLFVGMAQDRGPGYKFKSASVGWAVGGLTLVVSKIDRRPLVITSSLAATYELEYVGWSASYDLGEYRLGFASANQQNPYGLNTFAGDAQAFWVGWTPRDNVSVDFEVSTNDYRDFTSQDTRKASLAVSYSF